MSSSDFSRAEESRPTELSCRGNDVLNGGKLSFRADTSSARLDNSDDGVGRRGISGSTWGLTPGRTSGSRTAEFPLKVCPTGSSHRLERPCSFDPIPWALEMFGAGGSSIKTCTGHLHERQFRSQPTQVGFLSSHFFFRARQVRQPVRTR